MPKHTNPNNAVIDLGSNSIRMLVFRRGKEGSLFQVNRSLHYTKLAQGLSKTGMLSEDAMKRNMEAMDELQKIAQTYDVHHVYVFATNAMREAKNSEELVERVRQRFGLKIHIISGEREAQYGFLGVSQSFHGPVLIFDIGGGSTELVYGDRSIKAIDSLNLGCVRSSDDFIGNQDHVRKEEVEALFENAYGQINKALERFNLPEEFDLVGIGGTITSLSSVAQELKVYDGAKVHKSVVTFSQMSGLLSDFISKTLEERLEIVGLPEKRVDTIVAGTTIALAVLKAARKTRCHVCDFDNLEGAAYAKFMQETPREWDHQSYHSEN